MDNDIVDRLDTIISLLLPKFDQNSYDFKGIKLDVIKLCDYNNTIQDMMKKLSKPRQRIDDSLSILRKEGFIKTIKKGDDNVYIRLK
jgi:hypothetical protein